MNETLRKHPLTVAILVMPCSAIITILVIFPLLNGVRLSFTDASPLNPVWQWIGLSNFHSLLTDPVFWEVLGNTVLIVGTTVAAATVIGFLIALLLTSGVLCSNLLRTGFFQIWVVPWIAVAILWGWLFQTDYGVINALLRAAHVIDAPVPWLARDWSAKLALISAFTWRMIPFMMVVSLAAIQSVPKELMEAGAVDGAGYWQRVRHVLLPLVRGVLAIVCLLDAVRLFQEITVPWVLTGGGPVNATMTLSLHTYKTAFEHWEFGLASATGTVWLLFLVVVSVVYVKLLVARQSWRQG